MQLSDIRPKIDEVDSQIRGLFARRMELAGQVARIKAETQDDIYQPDREYSMIERQAKEVDAHIEKEYRALLRRMIEISRKYQYGRMLELRDCFPYAYETAQPEFTRLAMLPGELYLCDFCSRDLVIPAGNYEEMAEWIQGGTVDAGAGVIEEVASGVSDQLNRVLAEHKLYISICHVVCDRGRRKKLVLFSPRLIVREEDNRLKIMFVCPNRSGALAGILSMIADYGVNLTEIHSIPYSEGEDWNYRFFAELGLNLLDQEAKALIYQLSCETQELSVLGSYRCQGDFVLDGSSSGSTGPAAHGR